MPQTPWSYLVFSMFLCYRESYKPCLQILTEPHIQYFLASLRVLKPLCLCTHWAITEYLSKDFAVYDDARMFSVAVGQMLLLLSFMIINICWRFDLVWIYEIFLLWKANGVAVTETDPTMLLFLFFLFIFKSMVFVNSPAASHNSGTEKKNSIDPSCPSPRWVSNAYKEAQSCSPTDCPTDKGMD